MAQKTPPPAAPPASPHPSVDLLAEDADPRRLPEALRGLISRADQINATDIHIDCWHHDAARRLRVDGAVITDTTLGRDDARRLINQIKVAAELHIDGNVRAQEGHLRWANDQHTLDARVTVVPTAPHHESIHIRLLPPPGQSRPADHLGMRPEQLTRVNHLLDHSDGLTLIAGPTGAGKTTTLYALLNRSDLAGKIAIAIEDPAEFDLAYVRQIEADEDHGRSMADALRLALRMDPDLLAIGEVRDRESSRIAAHAALSGRTVFATIHGKDAAAAIEAAHFLGSPFYVLAGALRLVIAQDLVRVLCDNCKRPRPLTDDQRGLFAKHLPDRPTPKHLYEPNGCGRCHDLGFAGRTGVFQVAGFGPGQGAWLHDAPRQSEIRAYLHEQGVPTLTAEALMRVADGHTSLTECLHILEA